MKIMKHGGDVIIGAVGVGGSITIAQYNAIMGAVGVTLSVVYLCMKIFYFWRRRNDPPKSDL